MLFYVAGCGLREECYVEHNLHLIIQKDPCYIQTLFLVEIPFYLQAS